MEEANKLTGANVDGADIEQTGSDMADPDGVAFGAAGFDALREQYAPLLKSMVGRYLRLAEDTGVSAEAEDLRQEAELAFYSAWRSYREGSVTFGLYAKVCVRNRLISALRKLSRGGGAQSVGALNGVAYADDGSDTAVPWTEFPDEASADPLEKLIENERYSDLMSLINRELTPYEKLILICYADGKTYRETARIAGRNEKSVDNALARIRRKLKIR